MRVLLIMILAGLMGTCSSPPPLLEQVLEKNPGTVKIVYKNFPLRNHRYAAEAAMAALAAGDQGKFWEFHDRLFENYNRIDDQKIRDIARELGFNMDAFEKQMTDSKTVSRVRQDIQDGSRAGVKGTPTVFVNGRHLRNRSLKGFQDMIDNELESMKKSSQKPKP